MKIMHLSRAASQFTSFLIPVIEAQKKLGHHVSLCVANSPEAGQLRNAGYEVFMHNMQRSLNPVSIFRTTMQIKEVLREQQIEVVIFHNNIAAGMGRIAAWLAKTQYIVNFCHGFSCMPVQNPFLWWAQYWIEKILGRVTDAMLVMNDYDENLCKSHNIIKNTDKIFRIPAVGVDLNRYSVESSEDAKRKLAEELSIPENQKIVLCVARLIPEKGVFVLLGAARKICAKRDDVCFLLAGEGPSMTKLKKSVERNRIEDNFKLLGWRDDVSLLTKAADVFTLPTYYSEGLPVSILQAMACGKPVVATRYRGCEDSVVDYQTGFLVPVKQVDPLVDKISLLLDDKQLRMQMGQAGRQRVEQYFELDYCTKKIVDALEKAVN
jgi:glycosyltransferase involved in cell wall biosynthesis